MLICRFKKCVYFVYNPDEVKHFQLAFEAHAGQKRKSGEPFIIHPVEVAQILGELVCVACYLIIALYFVSISFLFTTFFSRLT